MAKAKRRRLFIVDGSSYVYRAYYASPPLTNSQGLPTNGTLVFTNMLLALMREEKPDLLCVTFDPSGDTFRHEIYPEYKATRDAPPDDLRTQFPYFRRIVKALGIPCYEIENFEADDVIATLTEKAVDHDFEVTIVSGDKDLLQLVRDDRVKMLDTMGRSNRTFTPKEVEERYGVPPEKVTDALALAGDSSDNIPGVPGIGKKTAAKLLNEFGSLDGILANIDKVSGKKRKENLTEYADQARLSRKLVELRDDVPIELEVPELANREYQPELEPLLLELEFDRLKEELVDHAPVEILPGTQTDVASEETHYSVIDTEEALDELVNTIHEHGRLAIHGLVNHDDPMQAHVVGLAVAWEPRHAAYIPLGHQTLMAGPQLSRELVLEKLSPLLGSREIRVLVHDYKLHWIILKRHGVELVGVDVDTQLASYLIDPSRNNHNVEGLAEELLSVELKPFTDIAGKGKKAKKPQHLDVEQVQDWMAERADMVMLIGDRTRPLLDERDLAYLHDQLEVPLSRVLGQLQLTGVRIDKEHLAGLSDEFLQEMQELEKRAFELVGHEFNLNSPKQLSEILFEELELRPVSKRRTTHGYTTNQAALEQITDQHELPAIVLDYRSVSKLRSTYTDALPLLENPETHRIHTRFNQAVAATGRLSSSAPNLQNIPIRTEQGRRIRKAFIPAEGWKLLSADYSQIELRLMAHFSEDDKLIEAFRLGQDIHARTAAEIFDVPIEEVSKKQRGVGKTINFGVLYGMGVTRLAREIDVSRSDAKKFMDTFYERFKEVRDFFETLVQTATREGYITTILDRRRYIPELRSTRRNIQSLGRRLAINTPIQGSAADIMKLGMIRADERVATDGFKARMLLQVHDELVFECPPDEVEALAAAVREEMEGAVDISVDLKTDVGVGDNWAQMEPVLE